MVSGKPAMQFMRFCKNIQNIIRESLTLFAPEATSYIDWLYQIK
jgi:hypothetical protein